MHLLQDLIRDVQTGLSRTPKSIPPRYFYDAVGSALFEAITHLPEYPVTETDLGLLTEHAEAIRQAAGPISLVAELGSGSGRKTSVLLEAFRPGRYVPIDVSPTALSQCAGSLRDLATVTPIHASYLDGLARIAAEGGPPFLVLFLGGSIGNFDAIEAREFLLQVRSRLRVGDLLLTGFDLVKEPDRLQRAYDDPTGVTAAFNKNLLARLNRELGADFDVAAFAHRATYQPGSQQVEMELVAQRAMTVRIAACNLAVRFEPNEPILTEISRKYQPEEIPALARACGFLPLATWTSSCWPFSNTLWRA
jgi:dimethylhistidine N-methyltransferase